MKALFQLHELTSPLEAKSQLARRVALPNRKVFGSRGATGLTVTPAKLPRFRRVETFKEFKVRRRARLFRRCNVQKAPVRPALWTAAASKVILLERLIRFGSCGAGSRCGRAAYQGRPRLRRRTEGAGAKTARRARSSDPLPAAYPSLESQRG
ncbi:hypothetical protein SKAU_G00398610 [Synaphobranchus kaupii]|uniref:Uncharacterized protein n=1 Tax=Synaphobranchus kaupii TaxID=118154 RepID=A0A9Q1E8Q2_SYNKA|nr:hypothetical protein SKAU_G00398610 [Synaphobranchus kaupii]